MLIADISKVQIPFKILKFTIDAYLISVYNKTIPHPTWGRDIMNI